MEIISHQKVTIKECADAGMALTLILLLIGLFSGSNLFFKLAVPILIINMIYPKSYYLFALLWFNLAHILGTIVSKIILTLVYYLVLTPVGLIRQLLGYDNLQLRKFKKDKISVMKNRNITFTNTDLQKPY